MIDTENIIREVREKIKNNPKYVNPMSKEFQEDIKRYGFENGYRYIIWMQHNGILKSSTSIMRNETENSYRRAKCKNRKEYTDKCAQRMGYKDEAEREKVRTWNKGIHLPMEFHDCPANFGVYKGEELFKRFLEEIIFEEVKGSGKGSRDGKIDFICKNPKQEFIDKYPQFRLKRNKEYKIQLKMRGLRDGYRWLFTHIDFNFIPDYFILCGWDSRDGEPMHIWIFNKYDMVKKGCNINAPKIEFYKRDSLTVVNKIDKIKQFENQELKDELYTLKNIYDILKEEL